MNPALNGSSVIRCFEHSNAIKISYGIIFDSTQDCIYFVYVAVLCKIEHYSVANFDCITTSVLLREGLICAA